MVSVWYTLATSQDAACATHTGLGCSPFTSGAIRSQSRGLRERPLALKSLPPGKSKAQSDLLHANNGAKELHQFLL